MRVRPRLAQSLSSPSPAIPASTRVSRRQRSKSWDKGSVSSEKGAAAVRPSWLAGMGRIRQSGDSFSWLNPQSLSAFPRSPGYSEKPAAHTRADWITSDREQLDAYVSDPLCSFMFTVNAYYNVFSGMIGMQRKESVYMIPKGLPILFMSGAEDPVGDFGKGVRKIYEKYRAAGIRDVTLRLYTGDRHEILNETDRDQVYADLLEWFEKHR